MELFPCLIAIRPPDEVTTKVKLLRQMIGKFHHNRYGSHEPHVTLLVSTFTDLEKVQSEIESVAQSHTRFEAQIEGLHIIQEDPLFGGRTLVYKLASNEMLTRLHQALFQRLRPLITDRYLRILRIRNPKFSQRAIENIKQHGHPYDEKDWIFHVTVCPLPDLEFDRIVDEARKHYDHRDSWSVDEISLYKSHLLKFRLFKGFRLNQE